jgi:serine/threonine-protein kinase RsbT
VKIDTTRQAPRRFASIQSPSTGAEVNELRASLGARAAGFGLREMIVVRIRSDGDVVSARERGRALAARAGFPRGDQTVIATAISEAAGNILTHARKGEVTIRIVEDGDRSAIVIIAHDGGPGIADIPRAMQDGYSTSGRAGFGLGAACSVMDDFEIVSTAGNGTTLRMRKWHTDA